MRSHHTHILCLLISTNLQLVFWNIYFSLSVLIHHSTTHYDCMIASYTAIWVDSVYTNHTQHISRYTQRARASKRERERASGWAGEREPATTRLNLFMLCCCLFFVLCVRFFFILRLVSWGLIQFNGIPRLVERFIFESGRWIERASKRASETHWEYVSEYMHCRYTCRCGYYRSSQRPTGCVHVIFFLLLFGRLFI